VSMKRNRSTIPSQRRAGPGPDPAVVELIRLSLDGAVAESDAADAISHAAGNVAVIDLALARAARASLRAPTPTALRAVAVLRLARERRREV